MIIPKAILLPSGTWRIHMRLGGEHINFSGNTKEEVEQRAFAYKETHKIQRKADTNKKYEKLLFGITELEKTEVVNSGTLPAVATVLEELDSMDGYKFEEFCANLLGCIDCFNGGNIHTTQKSIDYGADLIIECRDGKRISVQCKRLNSNVRIDAIQQVVASKTHYQTDACMVITNQDFTQSAKTLAYDNGVVLINRRFLTKLLTMYFAVRNSMKNKSQWDEFLIKIGYVERLPTKKK